MLEFEAAYHHNIVEKRKKRLVVLMALDSPTDLYADDASDTAMLRQSVAARGLLAPGGRTIL